MLTIVRVFNNSVVLAEDDRQVQVLLLGAGVGFQVRRGDPVDLDRIERRFVLSESAGAERVAALVQEIPTAHLDLAEDVVTLGRDLLGAHVTDHVLVPLADHLTYAIHRVTHGVAPIDYPLRWEVRTVFPRELAVGRQALVLISERTGVHLPESEAVPIALHFVNAQFGSAADISLTLAMTEALTQSLDIVRAEYGIGIDENSTGVTRFVAHLRYLFGRAQLGPETPAVTSELPEAVRDAQPREHACAVRIAAVLTERLGWEIGAEETVFLTLHVARLVASADRG